MRRQLRSLSGGALAALVFLFASVAHASPTPRMQNNPRTGKPIVTRGPLPLADEELRELLAGFSDVNKAFRIAKRESNGNADIVVDTRGMTPAELRAYWGKPALEELSVGLFQINVLAHASEIPGDTVDAKVAALKDPHMNVAVALAIVAKSGWAPWGG
jgi:hypothetical protein